MTSMHLLVAVTCIGVAVVPAPADGSETDTSACLTTYRSAFSRGAHWNWDVHGGDGGATWEPRTEPLARGVMLLADASGAGADDTRVTAPPVVAGPESRLTFEHDRALAPSDGLVLELTTDGGVTWQDGGPYLTEGGYNGTIMTPQGVRGAWTGPWPAPLGGTVVPTSSTLDLGSFDGESVSVSWRLLLSPEPAAGAPGAYAALLTATTWHRVLDADCLDGYATNPWVRCLGNRFPPLQADTAHNPDGTPAWEATDGLVWSFWTTSAHGLGPKDDRLVSDPFIVTPRTRVWFQHRYLLEAGRDGGTVEYSTDETTWTPVPSEWFLAGGYEGTRADGEPAWTGSFATHSTWWPTGPSPEWFLTSAVHLGDLAGEQVRIRLRLLQDEMRVGSAPGGEWMVFGAPHVLDTIVDPCPGLPIDEPPSEVCDSLNPPAAVAVPVLEDTETTLTLRVLVLLDVAEAAEIVRLRADPDPEVAAQAEVLLQQVVDELSPTFEAGRPAYEGVNVQLEFTYDVLSVVDGGAPSTTQELIDAAKTQFDGVRPPTADVVYVATDNLSDGTIAGQADCVGGARYDSHAFASGDIYRGYEPIEAFGLLLNDGLGAFTFAHEVGHLVGAQHHFANCVETIPTFSVFGDVTDACTLMINDNSLGQMRFSTVNGLIARGYVAEFIDPPQ
jgi:hypothetical protein